MNATPHIRPLADGELDQAFRLMHQLRTHLHRDEFVARVRRQQAAHGYTLIGAFSGQTLVGVAGVRRLETLARGAHIHLDDLVVDAAARGRGVGRAMLAHVEAHARSLGVTAVFVDIYRDVSPFYQDSGFSSHPSQLMRKYL